MKFNLIVRTWFGYNYDDTLLTKDVTMQLPHNGSQFLLKPAEGLERYFGKSGGRLTATKVAKVILICTDDCRRKSKTCHGMEIIEGPIFRPPIQPR